MVEQHWSYMDRFAATMIARGPTFTSDGTLTGSVHILDLPEPTAARTFAFEEPELPLREDMIASGPLLSDDGCLVLGAAVLLEAPDEDDARRVLSADRYAGIEVHQ